VGDTLGMSQLGWWIAGFLAAAWLGFALRRAWRRWVARRRTRRAFRGEREAETVLARAGYRVDERQPALDWPVALDGVPHPIQLRADLIVSRDGRRFVAEVKTGARAPRIETAATRRQLLEYAVAYDVDAVLLVDMEAETITEVTFAL
jgi:hypothetical protein